MSQRITVPNPAGMRLGLMITETWTAQEVGLILYSKQTSPSGETEQRYENVQIVEPEPGVFEIPAEYTIQERSPQTTPAR